MEGVLLQPIKFKFLNLKLQIAQLFLMVSVSTNK
jgi:hypothetical protein